MVAAARAFKKALQKPVGDLTVHSSHTVSDLKSIVRGSFFLGGSIP